MNRRYAYDHTFLEKIKYSGFWDSGFWEYAKIFFPIIFKFLLIILLVVLIFSFGDYKACSVYSIKGIEAQWNFWTGCLANHPKFGWIPIEEYFKTFNIYNP